MEVVLLLLCVYKPCISYSSSHVCDVYVYRHWAGEGAGGFGKLEEEYVLNGLRR